MELDTFSLFPFLLQVNIVDKNWSASKGTLGTSFMNVLVLSTRAFDAIASTESWAVWNYRVVNGEERKTHQCGGFPLESKVWTKLNPAMLTHQFADQRYRGPLTSISIKRELCDRPVEGRVRVNAFLL
jgi:hypothetical protein